MSGSKVCALYHSSTLLFEAKNLEKTGEGLKGSESGEQKGVNNKVRGCLLPPFLATPGLEAVLMSLLQGGGTGVAVRGPLGTPVEIETSQ